MPSKAQRFQGDEIQNYRALRCKVVHSIDEEVHLGVGTANKTCLGDSQVEEPLISAVSQLVPIQIDRYRSRLIDHAEFSHCLGMFLDRVEDGLEVCRGELLGRRHPHGPDYRLVAELDLHLLADHLEATRVLAVNPGRPVPPARG